MTGININPYHGRFAPTPSGALHFGSVVAAIGSYLHARHADGRWSVRIDDLDTPRVQPGAADAILFELEALGLEWDGEVIYQSGQHSHYAEALQQLKTAGHTFPCGCSRREIQKIDSDGIYPGTCRQGLPAGKQARSIRLRVADHRITCHDLLQGDFTQSLAAETGDFILHRADGIHAYHLAVVVDDARAGISHVVRGADLLPSTPQQILLQQLLGLPTPAYLHLPIAVDAGGHKLGKSTQARPIAELAPVTVLTQALEFLGQPLPPTAAAASSQELLVWAAQHWDTTRIPPVRTQLLES
ncbi:MAG: tRNA glutamyl-Q(34) synthetase GluQRS [Gammaproteobacteria bacterium]